MTAYILCSSCICEIWALYVSWIPYDHLYHAPCLACWTLFGSLVPAMCNRPSCAQVHELSQSHCGDNQEGTLFSWFHTYYTHLASMRFEHSVYRGSLMTIHIYIYIYIYVYILVQTHKIQTQQFTYAYYINFVEAIIRNQKMRLTCRDRDKFRTLSNI